MAKRVSAVLRRSSWRLLRIYEVEKILAVEIRMIIIIKLMTIL